MQQIDVLSEAGASSIARPASVQARTRELDSSPESIGSEPEVPYRAILRRHLRSVTAITLTCLAVGAMVTFSLPNAYRAKTVIELLVLNQEFMHNKEVDPNISAIATASYIETQAKLLYSETLQDRVVASVLSLENKEGYRLTSEPAGIRSWLGLMPKPREGLQSAIQSSLKEMKVKTDTKSNLLSIIVSGPTGQIAAETANAIAAQHILLLQETKRDALTQTIGFLNGQLEARRNELRTSEKALQSFSRSAGLIYLPEANRESLAVEKLRKMQAALQRAKVDRVAKQSRAELAHSGAPEGMPQMLDDGGLREANSRLAELQRQLAAMTAAYTPGHYKVVELQSMIAVLEDQVKQKRVVLLARINGDYEAAAREEELQRGDYQKQLAFVTDLAPKEAKYTMMKSELEMNRELYQSVLLKVKEANIISQLNSSNVRIVDRAKAPSFPYQPNGLVYEAIALLAGGMLSLLFILIRERLDGSIRMAGEMKSVLRLPELAVIPSEKWDIRTQVVSEAKLRQEPGKSLRNSSALRSGKLTNATDNWLHTNSAVAESFRSAVASILVWGRRGAEARKVLLITSAQPHAGKTTSVLNLGLGLVESGRRVLLIDGDLRLPSLGAIFGLERAAGLTKLLTVGPGSYTVDDLIQETSLPGLHVLPSGSRQRNVTQMLHLNQLGRMIESLRRNYDFILIDSPPLIPLTDARILAQHADAVILVARAGAITPEQSLNVQQCFLRDGTFVLGSILNDWDGRSEDPFYMSSYSKYADAASDC